MDIGIPFFSGFFFIPYLSDIEHIEFIKKLAIFGSMIE